MDLAAWIAGFKQLHERAKSGKLAPGDQATYEASREQFVRALLAAQGMGLQPGQTPRQSLRVARACQVDLELTKGRKRAITLDLGAGGFAALLADAPPPTERIGFSLRLPGSPEPLLGRAEVVDAQRMPAGSYRVCFAFRDLSEGTRSRLETLVLDLALEQVRF